MASSSKPFLRCKICNNLEYQGHREEDLVGNILQLEIHFSELDRDCPACRLIILSIESVVDRDCWDARDINPENGKESLALLIIHIYEDRPVTCMLNFVYRLSEHTRPYEHHTEGSPWTTSSGRMAALSPMTVKFLIYQSNEGCSMLPPPTTTLPPFRQDVALDYAISIIRRGQSHCFEKHQLLLCSKQPGSFVPKRLISIGSETSHLRLVEPNAVAGPYATLSYCWGKSKPPSTTKANLSARLHSIPEDSLPIVFRQAIRLARNLEIRYIWIDSLCIVQDSVEDWEAESQKMFLYYQNGSINIAAGISESPDTPLDKAVDDVWCPISASVHDEQGIPSLITTRRIPALYGSNKELGPLFTRSWTFQESFFAPRTINFTNQGIVWSCCSQQVLSDNYLDEDTQNALVPGCYLADISQSGVARGPNENFRTGLDLWRQLLFECSGRLVTFPTDRLPAISGAAAKFHEVIRCKYLAGHWYDDLPQSLAWHNQGTSSSRLRPLPREYVAPSWSWASVTGTVTYPSRASAGWADRMVSSAAKLLAVHCDVPGENSYGRVSSGFVDLRAKTVPIHIFLRDGFYRTTRPGWRFEPDSTLKQSGESVSRAEVGDTISEFHVSACCLHLAWMTDPDSSEKSDRPLVTHYALVLGWPDGEETSFRRVGLLESFSENAMDLFDSAVERDVRII